MHFLPARRQGRQVLMDQGVVKSYDPVTGIGIVVRDNDRSEVILRPGSLSGSVFRTLRQGQRLLFDTVEEEGRQFVTLVRLGQDGY
jgi:CspA family cold shock protein